MAAPLKDKDAAGLYSPSGTLGISAATKSYLSGTTTATTPYLGGVLQYTTCAHCGGYYQIGTTHYCPAMLPAPPTPTTAAFATVGDLDNVHRHIDEITCRLDVMDANITALTTVLSELLTAMKGIKQ